MRKPLVFVLSAVLALVLAPAAAQAHHLEQDTSSVVCVLANNQPTVKVSAHYVDFSPWDQPVYWATSIDKVTVGGGSLTWVGPEKRHEVSFPTTPGTHDVVYQASWNEGENGGYLSKRGLFCPPPVPPPVVVVVTPTPTPSPTPVATPTPPPPPPPPCVCPPPAKPKPRCVCPRIRVIKPDTSTRRGRHGTHRFGGRVMNNRHAKIVAVQITATAVGRGRPVCGGRTSRSSTMSSRGRTMAISLYNLDFFRHCLAWGDYRLTMRFRVVIRDNAGNVVCRIWCTRRVHLFNHDPYHPPS